MNVNLAPGKYVIAVSGGVDSMVLLDVLRQLPELDLVIAHFDHGIRPDSDEDRKLVETTAQKYELPFIYEWAELGPGVSEAVARTARYDFLRRTQLQTGAVAIVTAHHQDDMLETAIFNLLRGTGRKGLSPLQSRPDIQRPFLSINKQEILAHAHAHTIVWREDSTNQNEAYARNYIRAHIVPRLGEAGKASLLQLIDHAVLSNLEIDALLDELVPKGNSLDRAWFIALPHQLAREVMATWLRQNNVRDFDRKLLERHVTFAKVAQAGKTTDINRALILCAEKTFLKISIRPLS
jgi:tRNA(Ile)-lysidine synthetase-like protein